MAEGYASWKAEDGGSWDVPVAEALASTLEVFLAALPRPEVSAVHGTESGTVAPVVGSEPDSFDAIVTEMRAKRSDEMIEVLYKQLFALPEWFFICDPYEERAPAQWVFPDVADGSPAVLAFTSRERATLAAVELGLYESGAEVPLMPAPVDAAVGWITSSDFENEWLNFNQTRNDFPLYVDDAANLFNLA